MRYAISVPAGYDASDPRPLVLALHPGGGRTPYYGEGFLRQIAEPALRSWDAIFVAPDAPTGRWANATAEDAVMALIDSVIADYAIDEDRILVTGFSLGGRGTWFLATRHADRFTGAIPIAGSPADDDLDGLGSMPIHIIHSRDDEVVAFGPAREAGDALQARDHPVWFTELRGIGHFAMGGYVDPLRAAGVWMLDQWEGQR
ncbi:MAG: prolyl oligopeptidase family serine peptidase [Dehalococcoidia bacterium]|jgi:predicted peptidase|nr:prolyl oligopeptidase family serine peptidase [Dehalococcoidia bacterium]